MDAQARGSIRREKVLKKWIDAFLGCMDGLAGYENAAGALPYFVDTEAWPRTGRPRRLMKTIGHGGIHPRYFPKRRAAAMRSHTGVTGG
jgi:hypothetical protein